MFSLFVFNSIERHENNRQGSYFFASGKFLGHNPPTIEELKDKLVQGNDRYIQMLQYYSDPVFFPQGENSPTPKLEKNPHLVTNLPVVSWFAVYCAKYQKPIYQPKN